MRPALITTLLLAAGCAMSSSANSASKDQPQSAALAKALAGRTAGKPTSCINLRDIRSSRIIDDTAIIYETSPRRWYVNQPPGGCAGLKPDRTIVSRTPSTSLCRGDIIRITDPPSPIEYGSCGLGEFVPYTR